MEDTNSQEPAAVPPHDPQVLKPHESFDSASNEAAPKKKRVRKKAKKAAKTAAPKPAKKPAKKKAAK